MLNHSLLLLFTLPLTAAPAPASPADRAPDPFAPGLVLQDDDPVDEVPDKREDIKQLLAQMAGHVKKRGAEDAEAIAVIEQLYQEFPNCGPKDRKSIAKSLGKNFNAKRRENDDGTFENRLYLATAVALADMGPESVDILEGEIGSKMHKDNLELQRRILLSLGMTKDEDAVKPLIKMLTNKDPSLQAAAAEALGEFGEADQKLRKEAFADILKQLMGAKTAVDGDPADPIARNRYETISGPMISALQRLAGEDLRAPEDWQHWWNKNKKDDWDE